MDRKMSELLHFLSRYCSFHAEIVQVLITSVERAGYRTSTVKLD